MASNRDTTATDAYLDRPVNPHRLAAILDHAGRRILDAGCGNGAYVLRLIDQYDIHGLDTDEYPTWSSHPARFRRGSVATLPYDDGAFDTIVSFEVLEHVPDPLTVLKEFWRVSRANIILSVPNCELSPGMQKSRLAYYHYTDITHCNFFTLDSISKTCEAAGFTVTQRELINRVNLLPLLKEA